MTSVTPAAPMIETRINEGSEGDLRPLDITERVLLLMLMAIGAALRFYRIDTSLWYDEIVTVVASVRSPLGEIVSQFPGDNHHPLYSVLAHLSVAVFGEAPWSLRLPAALLGVASIPLTYMLGRAVASRAEAAAATIVLTVSYHHIWFSQNARGYTAVLFCVLLSTFALVRWFESGRRAFLALFAISTTLGAYAHLTTILVAVGQAIACAIAWGLAAPGARVRVQARALAMAFVGSALLTVLIYAPMLADVGSAIQAETGTGGERSTLTWTAGALLRGLQVGFGALWGIALGATIFVSGGLDYVRRRPTVALLFSLPVVMILGTAMLLDRPIRPRFVFFAFGFALLFIMRGGAVLGDVVGRTAGPAAARRGRSFGVIMLTVAAVAFSLRSLPYGYRYPKQDYVQAVTFIEQTMRSDDIVAVVSDGGDIPVIRYLGRPWTRIDTAEELDVLRGQRRTVWVLSTFPSYLQSGQPRLWGILKNECEELQKFSGTVEDGSITVRRCP